MKAKSLTALSLVLVVAIVAVTLAAGGGAKNRRPQPAANGAVSVRQTSLGPTLVDAQGRTLYLFEADKHNVSKLSAAGRAVWPPFTARGAVNAKGAIQAAKLGTTTGHGIKQVTYNGHPLYYYVGDHAPGSTRGQHLTEFGALWFVLSPGGNAITAAAHTTVAPSSQQPPAAAPTTSYGY